MANTRNGADKHCNIHKISFSLVVSVTISCELGEICSFVGRIAGLH